MAPAWPFGKRLGLGVLAMTQFMVVLDFTIVNVALPSIQTGLHIGTSTLQWLVSGYAVAFGGFLLLGGRLTDLFGQARMFRIGLVVFVVASVAGGLAVELAPAARIAGNRPPNTSSCTTPEASPEPTAGNVPAIPPGKASAWRVSGSLPAR